MKRLIDICKKKIVLCKRITLMRSIYPYYGVYVSFYETYNLVSGNPAKFLQPTAHFSTDFRGWLKITDSPQE